MWKIIAKWLVSMCVSNWLKRSKEEKKKKNICLAQKWRYELGTWNLRILFEMRAFFFFYKFKNGSVYFVMFFNFLRPNGKEKEKENKLERRNTRQQQTNKRINKRISKCAYVRLVRLLNDGAMVCVASFECELWINVICIRLHMCIRTLSHRFLQIIWNFSKQSRIFSMKIFDFWEYFHRLPRFWENWQKFPAFYPKKKNRN